MRGSESKVCGATSLRLRRRQRQNQSRNEKNARTAKPPIAPPTIGAIGVVELAAVCGAVVGEMVGVCEVVSVTVGAAEEVSATLVSTT